MQALFVSMGLVGTMAGGPWLAYPAAGPTLIKYPAAFKPVPAARDARVGGAQASFAVPMSRAKITFCDFVFGSNAATIYNAMSTFASPSQLQNWGLQGPHIEHRSLMPWGFILEGTDDAGLVFHFVAKFPPRKPGRVRDRGYVMGVQYPARGRDSYDPLMPQLLAGMAQPSP